MRSEPRAFPHRVLSVLPKRLSNYQQLVSVPDKRADRKSGIAPNRLRAAAIAAQMTIDHVQNRVDTQEVGNSHPSPHGRIRRCIISDYPAEVLEKSHLYIRSRARFSSSSRANHEDFFNSHGCYRQ